MTPVPKPEPRVRQSKPLKRSGRIKVRRTSKRFAAKRDPAYQDYIRSLHCLVADGCVGRVEAAHVKTRAAGGDDRGNLVPLCTKHHREQHQHGIRTFEAKYKRNLVGVAWWLTLGWWA